MNVGRHGRPLEPRNGHTLVVAIVARISGCSGQKEVSLEDQIDHAKQVVDAMYDGPVDYRTITTKGKGERLDRPELAEIEAMIRSGELDLLVAEDLGRIVRGTETAWLCGIANDHGTRVIAPTIASTRRTARGRRESSPPAVTTSGTTTTPPSGSSRS